MDFSTKVAKLQYQRIRADLARRNAKVASLMSDSDVNELELRKLPGLREQAVPLCVEVKKVRTEA